jgi:hypothetical protein
MQATTLTYSELLHKQSGGLNNAPMKHNVMLIVASLLSLLLTIIHLTQDGDPVSPRHLDDASSQ